MTSMMHAVAQWFRRRNDEITGDRVLRLYGVALAYANVVTFAHWILVQDVAKLLSDNSIPICWPFWENCADYRGWSTQSVSALLWIYLALSLATGAAFLSKRHVRWGYWGLVVVNAIRLAIMARDFTLRLNQHYMLSWVTFAFLFCPLPRVLVPALLASFYFWAGVLKLDMEWFSGAALYRKEKLWMPAALIPASCVYVVVLETVMIFGLYARRNWMFWGTFAQLVLFHVYSWPIVNFYYPMLMFGLISFFPLVRLLRPSSEWVSPAQVIDARARWPAAALLGVFAASQFLPLAFPGDSAITGEGRLFALHMFDALVRCQGTEVLHRANGTTKTIHFDTWRYPKRIACDPVLFLSLAKNECRRLHDDPDAVDFDLHLQSKRSTDPALRDVIDIANFCASATTYDMWRPNDWIRR